MSWEQLGEILAEGRRAAETEASAPPVACPNDGTLLEAGPSGELHCPFDGYIWPGYGS